MKTRALLALVAILTIAGQVLVLQSGLGIVWKFILHVADGILMTSALTMLFFSFFRVGTTANGELCYNSSNHYWRIMFWYCNDVLVLLSDPFQKEVSLCKAFWLTVLALISFLFFPALTTVLLFVVWHLYLKLGLLKLLLFVASIAGVVGFLIYTEDVPYKSMAWIDSFLHDKPRAEKVFNKLFGILMMATVVAGLVGLLVVLPIVVIMNADVDLYHAVIYYLVGVAGIVLVSFGTKGLIWLFFKYLPSVLGDTIFGQFLIAKKKQFCPTLVACPVKNSQVSPS